MARNPKLWFDFSNPHGKLEIADQGGATRGVQNANRLRGRPTAVTQRDSRRNRRRRNRDVLLIALFLLMLALAPASIDVPAASQAIIPASIPAFTPAATDLAADYPENEIPADPREYAERAGSEGRDGSAGSSGDDRPE